MIINSYQPTSEDILKSMDNCTKCGICNSYCPVSNVTNQFPGPKYSGPQTQRFRSLEDLVEISPELCNGCGVCMSVCPNEVAITDIITHAKSNLNNKNKKISFVQTLLNRPDTIGKLGNIFPALSNFILHNSFFRYFASQFFHLDSNAPLPNFHGKKFKKFLEKIKIDSNKKNIIYFSGCAVDNYDSEVGIAVIKLMSNLGYNVITNTDLCCSLPMLSSGEWDAAINRSKKLINSLSRSLDLAEIIISTSTSCSLTIKKKYSAYLNFTDPKSAQISQSTKDICEYILEKHTDLLAKRMKPIDKKIFYHGPCQLRSHGIGQPAVELLRLIPKISLSLSEAECCGIGGTYGYVKGRNEISELIGRSLSEQIKFHKPDVILCDSETCRWNIEKNSGIKTLHPIQIILESLNV